MTVSRLYPNIRTKINSGNDATSFYKINNQYYFTFRENENFFLKNFFRESKIKLPKDVLNLDYIGNHIVTESFKSQSDNSKCIRFYEMPELTLINEIQGNNYMISESLDDIIIY